MQDRICGRCDCVVRTGRDSKNLRWYKEPPSRYQGTPTSLHFLERGQGNPHGSLWVLGTAANWADRETEENQQLRAIFTEEDHHILHTKEYGGIRGLHPLIATQGTDSRFWTNLLGVNAQGEVSKGRGLLWRRWLAGDLFVTHAIKCYTSGKVPKKQLDIFAKNCQVHLSTQFDGSRNDAARPKIMILAGEQARRMFLGAMAPEQAAELLTPMDVHGIKVLPAPAPDESGGLKAWATLEAILAPLLGE